MDETIQKSAIMVKRLRSKSESRKSGTFLLSEGDNRCRPVRTPNIGTMALTSISFFLSLHLENEYGDEVDPSDEQHGQTPPYKRQLQSHQVSPWGDVLQNCD